MKQSCNLELSYDYQTGQTFLIDNIQGTQKRVKSNGQPITNFQPYKTGFRKTTQSIYSPVQLEDNSTKISASFYTPMNDKFYGYAQQPRVILRQDFIKQRFLNKPQLKSDLFRGIINSYNKPNTVMPSKRIHSLRHQIDYGISESSLNSSVNHLTASMKDSFETLAKLDVQVLEQRKQTKHTNYENLIKEDHFPLKTDLKHVQFTTKKINGNSIKSPQLGFLLNYWKQNKKGDIPEDQLPLIEIIKAYKNKEKQTKLFSKQTQLVRVEDQQQLIQKQVSRIVQTVKSSTTSAIGTAQQKISNINTNLTFNEKEIIQRYFTQDPQTEQQRSPFSDVIKKLITKKMQEQNQKTYDQMLEAYPRTSFSNSKNQRARKFETHIFTNSELYEREKPLGLIFYMSKRIN